MKIFSSVLPSLINLAKTGFFRTFRYFLAAISTLWCCLPLAVKYRIASISSVTAPAMRRKSLQDTDIFRARLEFHISSIYLLIYITLALTIFSHKDNNLRFIFRTYLHSYLLGKLRTSHLHYSLSRLPIT